MQIVHEVDGRLGPTSKGVAFALAEVIDSALAAEVPEEAGSNSEAHWIFARLSVQRKAEELRDEMRRLIPLAQRAYGICLAQCGRLSFETASSMSQLAEVLSRAGEFREALELADDAVRIFETLLGPKDPRTVRAACTLGLLAARAEGKSDASEIRAAVVDVRSRLGAEMTQLSAPRGLSPPPPPLGAVRQVVGRMADSDPEDDE